ncbi:hypothetical protein GCM10022225_77150 [Plantactinospora mayteni]|uniref:Uncharacterized protein n=1 Tax=Plantactinospora mayteni TaxID=566021 RepID=A0ABQ4F2M0_9ACTN|nr:hypothetical protein Pma05_77200 [Plantactinospora mayteni]
MDEVLGASLASEGEDLHLWFSAGTADERWRIYHTVSADGAAWSPPTAVAGLTAAGGRDRVLLASVLRRGNEWWMWYAGHDRRGRRVHVARSVDGRTWQRRGVAVALGEPGSADADSVDCPAVVEAADGTLVMAYGAANSRSVAAAVSRDGVAWRKLGPILHRRLDGPDSRRVWYPLWLPTGPDTADLLYTGKDDHGRWSISTAGRVDLALMAARPTPLPLTSAADAALTQIRAAVTADYLVEPDYHRPAPVYRSPDGRVEQLRPSTSPVFAVRDEHGRLAGGVPPGEAGHLVLQAHRSAHRAGHDPTRLSEPHLGRRAPGRTAGVEHAVAAGPARQAAGGPGAAGCSSAAAAVFPVHHIRRPSARVRRDRPRPRGRNDPRPAITRYRVPARPERGISG